jgi:hypothetical protein
MICPHCGGNANYTGQNYKDGAKKYRCTKKECGKRFREAQTAEDTLDPIETENIRDDTPSKGKAGPKKVMNEATRHIGNNLAGMLADSTQVKAGTIEKGLTYQESQSIVHPTIRIVWRRIPEVAKDSLPDIPGLEKEDVADLLEIATSLARFILRRAEIWYHGWRNKQLNKGNTPIQRGVQPTAPATSNPDVDAFFSESEEQPPDLMARSQQAQPSRSSNGHSPEMVAMLPDDMGMVEG